MGRWISCSCCRPGTVTIQELIASTGLPPDGRQRLSRVMQQYGYAEGDTLGLEVQRMTQERHEAAARAAELTLTLREIDALPVSAGKRVMSEWKMSWTSMLRKAHFPSMENGSTLRLLLAKADLIAECWQWSLSEQQCYALSTTSGSGRQCSTGGHQPPLQYIMTSATWLRWYCLFAGSASGKAPRGGPAQAPGEKDTAASLWYPSQPFQMRGSDMQLASNIRWICPVPSLHLPVLISL